MFKEFGDLVNLLRQFYRNRRTKFRALFMENSIETTGSV